MSFYERILKNAHRPQTAGMDQSCDRTPSMMNRILWNARWPRMAALGLVICTSSCSSASKYVQDTFRKGDQPPVASTEEKTEEAPEVKHAYAAAKKDQKKVEPLAHAEKKGEKPETDAKPETSSEEVLGLIAKGDDPFAKSTIQQASNEEVDPFAKSAPKSTEPFQFPDEPRAPLNPQVASASNACPPIPVNLSPPGGNCPPTAPCAARPFPGSEPSKDEFVCDGGDKGTPVHYEGRDRAGLDVEDTIAEYKDDTGAFHMKPSTQACVYAPRFGSVSSATLPETGRQVAKAAGHQDQASAGGLETKMVVDEKTQTDEALGVAMRARASGINDNKIEGQIHQTQAAENHVKLLNAYEDFRFLREGQFELANHAVIAQGVTAAQEWADGRRPIIVAKDEGGQLVQGRFTAQDYTGVEDKRTPGDLKLVKVADRGSAHPGDIVTFTIRFDNVGERDLTSVRIVDNLSPRLAYVEDSISSNLNGKVDVDDNGLGGKLLTFEFDEPLKGKTGGFVSFQCRVR
ncbi:hypothetical protein SH661x_000699 [Planctomicrobium sp. SH661]|uniref:hypothetical protein n=1 Tax=Planctomicrobium sp. SH661 TaxID=3448124 RepID=UPI003F5C5D5D